MTLKKTKWTAYEKLIQKVNASTILKPFPLAMLIIAAAFLAIPSYGLNNKDTTSLYSTCDDTYKQMIDYSRPGKHHQLLADLVGTWTSKGKHFNFIDSVKSEVALEFSTTVVRKSFANGRYFIVDIISEGKLEMPIQDGKMKEVKFQGLEIEGYDNVKKKFVKSAIGNHLNSGIPVIEGVYDSTTKTITFDSVNEMVPGLRIKERMLFIFQDKDHYKLEYYLEENVKFRLGSEINFTRVKGK